MVIFVVCTLISTPSLSINLQGREFNHEEDLLNRNFGVLTMGNIGSYIDMDCTSCDLPATRNGASYINFKCEDGKKLTGLQHFGLAFQNQSCTGIGHEKTVQTIDRCSIGSMENA